MNVPVEIFMILSIFCGIIFFRQTWNTDPPTDQEERNEILWLPDIFIQKDRAEDAGEHGFGKFDDEQFWKLAVFDDPKPDAIADDVQTQH